MSRNKSNGFEIIVQSNEIKLKISATTYEEFSKKWKTAKRILFKLESWTTLKQRARKYSDIYSINAESHIVTHIDLSEDQKNKEMLALILFAHHTDPVVNKDILKYNLSMSSVIKIKERNPNLFYSIGGKGSKEGSSGLTQKGVAWVENEIIKKTRTKIAKG